MSSRKLFGMGIAVLFAIVAIVTLMSRQPALATGQPDWDRSSLSVTGQCLEEGGASFTVTNEGDRAMAGDSYWELRDGDGNLLETGPIPALGVGESVTFTFGYGGQLDFRAYQRPGHPGLGYAKSVVTCDPDIPNEFEVNLVVGADCDGLFFELFVNGESVGSVSGGWADPYTLESFGPGLLGFFGFTENPGDVYVYTFNGAPSSKEALENFVIYEPEECLQHHEVSIATEQWNNCDGWERSAKLIVDGAPASSWVVVDSGTYPSGGAQAQPAFDGTVTIVDGPPEFNGSYPVHFDAMDAPEDCGEPPQVSIATEQWNNCDGWERSAQLLIDGVGASSFVVVDSGVWPPFGAQSLPPFVGTVTITDGPAEFNGTYPVSFPGMDAPVECGKEPPAVSFGTEVNCEYVDQFVVVNGQKQYYGERHFWSDPNALETWTIPAVDIDLGNEVIAHNDAVTVNEPTDCTPPWKPSTDVCEPHNQYFADPNVVVPYGIFGFEPAANAPYDPYEPDKRGLVFAHGTFHEGLSVFAGPFTYVVHQSGGNWICTQESAPAPAPETPTCPNGNPQVNIVRVAGHLWIGFGCTDPLNTVTINGVSETLMIDPTGQVPGAQPRYSKGGIPCSADVQVHVVWPTGAVSDFSPVCQ